MEATGATASVTLRNMPTSPATAVMTPKYPIQRGNPEARASMASADRRKNRLTLSSPRNSPM
jgi:hypothetical protein